MAVVSTGVHDTWILTAKSKSGVFINGKCIDICTKSDCLALRGSFASLDHRPETVIIRIIVRSQPHFFKKFSNLPGGIFFLKRKLRMRMKITPLLDDPVLVLFCQILKIHVDLLPCKYIFWIYSSRKSRSCQWKSETPICNPLPGML